MTDWDAKMADAMTDELDTERVDEWDLEHERIDVEAPDDEPEMTMPSEPIQPLHVVVVGSAAWDEPLLVQAALLTWANQHASHPVMLWTAGAPDGAEVEAREFGQRAGWRVSETKPELLLEIEATVVFAFLTPEGEARELVDLIATRRPVRVMTLETLRPRSRWSKW